MPERPPLVGIIMGSQSDWQTMRYAAEMLLALDIPCEARIVSAHRTPDRLVAYAQSAQDRGLAVIIAGILQAGDVETANLHQPLVILVDRDLEHRRDLLFRRGAFQALFRRRDGSLYLLRPAALLARSPV